MLRWEKKDLGQIRKGRHRGRTDLIWLCKEVLGFKDVDYRVHGPMVEKLVQFKGVQGEDRLEISNGVLTAQYEPLARDPVELLENDEPWRRRLILDPRGWFKTSINCVGHAVQVNLNLPDIYMAIIHAKENIAANIVGDTIKPNYINNQKFRWLYPEFCSPWNNRKGGFDSLGNTFKFTTPARTIHSRFPTFTALGSNSALASLHYQWMKFTDIVNEQNSLNPDQLEKVSKMFLMSENLLVDPRYFIDVEGTCYDYTDLYNEKIIEAEEKKPPEEREYKIFCRGAFVRKGPEGEKEKFVPEEREWEFLIQCPVHPQEEGKGWGKEECGICGEKLLPVTRWPERWTVTELLKRREKDPKMFADQQLNDPSAAGDEGKMFNIKRMIWVPEKDIQKIPFRYKTMAVDLAEKVGQRNDFTAMSVIGWDQAGRGYMVDGVLGRWLPETVIDLMFRMYFKWKCSFLKIEESSFTRGLAPAINKKMLDEDKRIAFEWLPREPDESKKDRINSLQPFFNSGMLRFSDGLDPFVQEQIKKQFDRHPKGRDDMIDTLADQFQGKEDFARTQPRRDPAEFSRKAMDLLIWDQEEWKRRYQGIETGSESRLGVL